jgi:hypothetical protein
MAVVPHTNNKARPLLVDTTSSYAAPGVYQQMEPVRLYNTFGSPLIPVAQGSWTAWTPGITQPGAVTFTTTYCEYLVIGKMAFVQARLAVTSAGTAGTGIVITGIPAGLEHAQGTNYTALGQCFIIDSSAGAFYPGIVRLPTTNTIDFVDATGGGSLIGATPNFALASGDTIMFAANWKIA